MSCKIINTLKDIVIKCGKPISAFTWLQRETLLDSRHIFHNPVFTLNFPVLLVAQRLDEHDKIPKTKATVVSPIAKIPVLSNIYIIVLLLSLSPDIFVSVAQQDNYVPINYLNSLHLSVLWFCWSKLALSMKANI